MILFNPRQLGDDGPGGRHPDPKVNAILSKTVAFFEAKGMADYGCQFTLEGQQLDAGHSNGLLAVNAVASLAARHPRSRQFVVALWNTPIPDGLGRYYDGLLYLMALLHCGGEFRIWNPGQ